MSSYRKCEGHIQRIDATLTLLIKHIAVCFASHEPMSSAFPLRRDPEKPISFTSNNRVSFVSNTKPGFLLQLTPIAGSINTHVMWEVNPRYGGILGNNSTPEFPYKEL